MPSRIRRRDLLTQSCQAALGFSLLQLGGCANSNSAAVDDGGWSTRVAELEKRIPGLMADAKVAGLSIALIRESKLAWRGAFGVKDRTSNTPLDEGTIFEAGSMSKPVFAYTVMKLAEKGVISLDTPLTKYTTARFLEGDGRLDLITARQVLSHTSGFQNWRSDKEPLKINFTPGQKWMYSGEGYSYLQSVITHVTGQPIEQYMKTNVFDPFQMTSTGYVWNDMFERRMARPHDKDDNPQDNKKSSSADVARYGSSGALLTTPTDYARFLIEVIDPKASDTFRLKADSVRDMLSPHVTASGFEHPSSWGLGWQIMRLDNEDFICHGGDNEGFHSMVAASPARKCGFVVMTNGENGWKIIQKPLFDDLLLHVL